jgi:phenylpropionate dioxygenase-like ring-hydroxylating dioxygenase large terminal subunit
MDETEGRYSVAFPTRWWYPAARSRDLGGTRPAAITLMDTPLALFRDGTGAPRALLDRCPHRNLALSLGRVHPSGDLACGYHGWRFDGSGRCTAVPGLAEGDGADAGTRSCASFPTAEQDGFVWVWGDPDSPPGPGDRTPFALPAIEGSPSNVGEVVFAYDLDCTLHAALENALDVPHTAFLHQGLFRDGARPTSELTAVRRPVPDGLEVEYVGEPAAFGPLKAPSKTFEHWDRFFLPGIAQIEYRVEGWIRIVNTIVHLPLSPFKTRAWFVVRFWTRLPAAVVKPVVLARGRQILKQDAKVLAQQTDNVRRFGQERYASTDLDLMGNGIWRLLRQAERDQLAPPPADEDRRVTFRV